MNEFTFEDTIPAENVETKFTDFIDYNSVKKSKKVKKATKKFIKKQLKKSNKKVAELDKKVAELDKKVDFLASKVNSLQRASRKDKLYRLAESNDVKEKQTLLKELLTEEAL